MLCTTLDARRAHQSDDLAPISGRPGRYGTTYCASTAYDTDAVNSLREPSVDLSALPACDHCHSDILENPDA